MMKSKLFSVVVGLALASSLVGAQATQSAAKIKKVKQQIEFSEDVQVGSTLLKKGFYQISNDDQGLTFRRLLNPRQDDNNFIVDNKTKPVVVKCTLTTLEEKHRGTRLEMPVAGGVKVLKSVTLDDTNVTYTIPPQPEAR